MPPESWLVLTVAAAFLLLGIAGSPLAWCLLLHRRSRMEQLMETRWQQLADQVHALDERLTHQVAINPAGLGITNLVRADLPAGRGPVRATDTVGRTHGGVVPPAPGTAPAGQLFVRADSAHEPPLIAVPNLEGVHSDRDVKVTGLKERYAAIWALADTGTAPEVIARATGQPVGQIELILGLRRQIDGTRTISSHASHF